MAEAEKPDTVTPNWKSSNSSFSKTGNSTCGLRTPARHDNPHRIERYGGYLADVQGAGGGSHYALQRGERPLGGPSNEIHPQPRNGTRTHREQNIRHLQNHRQADPQGAADESASRNRVHRGQRRTDSLKDSPSERMFFSYGMKRIRSPRPEIKIGASQIGRSYFYKNIPQLSAAAGCFPDGTITLMN